LVAVGGRERVIVVVVVAAVAKEGSKYGSSQPEKG
jgi:hypothetical protein